ncbi:type II/IV secretion system ATPase subunit [Candidatus Aciduliprofundum boonei]|uniref:Type II secretion system protein E n=1 Tax=Aciduliprofundum boonei (strain DSM 19572 / T469) TaxID=439481 RepID=B5IFF3_ACIB4|nr:type II/IV secretion system ATPase subunit [Candidatus Aciduliprofundum boonei]ADD07821.1 type II secretion system protein E [Aciduliprofundum boonei T469]EDY35057.1 Type II/IV secretion system protein [Aciduliprofundum boonei T469]HII54485.1 type II/IV secretion system ATPase subunit [Candidatus Aciduliprofundum boonei]
MAISKKEIPTKLKIVNMMRPIIKSEKLKVKTPKKHTAHGSNITPLPEIKSPSIKEIEVDPIEEPYSYVRILFDEVTSEYIYEVIEPPITDDEKKILENIKSKLIEVLELKDFENDEERKEYLMEKTEEIIEEMNTPVDSVVLDRLKYYVYRDFLGYGLVQVPMHDSEVEDISCDGVNIPIYIYHRMYGSIRSNLKFQKEDELDNYVIWIVQKSGRHISISNPMVDASLPDGSRLQATLGKHVTKRGSSFTIRRFKPNPFTPIDLIRFKTMSREMMAYIWLAVENGMSIIVCGGTASGKTTTLNAILLFIPPNMKIASIEDTRELNLPHENWIPSLTREGLGEPNPVTGKRPGEIDMFDLLKAALRQRPQYIMVGEVRGPEAYTVFQAMATGKTCYTTFHADDVKSMVHRFENAPINLPRALITALDIVILQAQVKVGTAMTRRVKSITEIVGLDPETNEIITNNAYTWNPADDTFNYSGHSYIYEKISAIKGWSQRRMELEVKRRERILEYMEKLGVRYYRDVARIVAAYYKKPEEVLKRVEEVLSS